MPQILVIPVNSLCIFVSTDHLFAKTPNKVLLRGPIVNMDEAIEIFGEKEVELLSRLCSLAGIEKIEVYNQRLEMTRSDRFTWAELRPQIRKVFEEFYHPDVTYVKPELFELWNQ